MKKGRSAGSSEDGADQSSRPSHEDAVSTTKTPSTTQFRTSIANERARSGLGADLDRDSNDATPSSKPSAGPEPSPARIRRSVSSNGKLSNGRPQSLPDESGAVATASSPQPNAVSQFPFPNTSAAGSNGSPSHGDKTKAESASEKVSTPQHPAQRARLLGPCSVSFLALFTTILGIALLGAILNSTWTRQLDDKGCRMSYMRPSYVHLREFDTEHTRFASKYNLHLYREQGIDEGSKLRGVPVLFIPGNAGSYRQVRPIASESAKFFQDNFGGNLNPGEIRNLDFFTVDFNEDITAFHGQTLQDQAEYLNEAIRYILSLYLDPRMSVRDAELPDPSSVLVLGHSMGGVVARAMLTLPNHEAKSINTIVTMSAPHSRAPVTFDGQIVDIYDSINEYWRHAYAQKWANNNPLWHVTLISVAGGGLDTVVPSDYASIESLIPETHGFTVFTTGIPNVWTSMDHQAILWCDQFRKVVIRALYDVVDVSRSSQTKPRADRMRIFRKWFLTGMESSTEKSLPSADPMTLLSIEDDSGAIMRQEERLVLQQLGSDQRLRAHLMPIPPVGSLDGKQFTLLTDASLTEPGVHGELEVLFCSVAHAHSGHQPHHLPRTMDFSKKGKAATKLACTNPASDKVVLPASTKSSQHPFVTAKQIPHYQPFSYLQYNVEELADYEFVAMLDRATKRSKHFVLAEFSDIAQSRQTQRVSPWRLAMSDFTYSLAAERSMTTEISFPLLESSLLAYQLQVSTQPCRAKNELFAPLLRQYLVQPYESKFFVNVENAGISIHGVSPFVPPPMMPKLEDEQGLSLQFWTDPRCRSTLNVTLSLDVLGSLGKLYMRYRTVFAAFPLLVVTLVLRKQFRVYDSAGVFISFAESLDLSLRQSIPMVLASLTFLSLSLRGSENSTLGFLWDSWDVNQRAPSGFHSNDLLTGTQDTFFWFMMPVIGVICVGVCAILHYITVGLTLIMSLLHRWVSTRPMWQKYEGRRQSMSPTFIPSSPRRRIIVIACLLFMVSTFIPYQFAYLVACLVQLFTTMRALRIASEASTPASHDFYNYCHSILLLMLWVLPINLPTLAVWLRNLMVQWLTPFSSHHNVFSIMPFLLLVENLSSGNMVPRITGISRHFTSVFLFATAIYAAVFGVSHAYVLHYLINGVAAWLVLIHSTSESWTLTGIGSFFDETRVVDPKGGKTP